MAPPIVESLCLFPAAPARCLAAAGRVAHRARLPREPGRCLTTAVGKAQVAAAAGITPALRAFTRTCARARTATAGDHSGCASNLQLITQVLAGLISAEGYAVKHRREFEFLAGQAAVDPDGLSKAIRSATTPAPGSGRGLRDGELR